MSSTSLRMTSSALALDWAMRICSRRVPSSSCASIAASIPKMPFMGVRSSWLMIARNSDLALLARSARSSASRRAR